MANGVVMFLGVETHSWSDGQFQAAFDFCRAHGCTAVAIKVADGTNQWYGGLGGFAHLRDMAAATGLKAVPYTYCYGNKYGALSGEISQLATLMRDYGSAMADMEAEWNGQVAWAQEMETALRPVPGVFYVTTWADPAQQNWTGVLNALAPCINAWVPQAYNNWLASQETSQFAGEQVVQLALDLTQEFGANDPASIAQSALARGNTVVWLWEYQPATANPGLVDTIAHVMDSGGASPMWTKQSDGSAVDDKGHHVGAGFASYIFAHGWQSTDGLTGENYYNANESFASLSNGVTLHYTAGYGVDTNGAKVAAELFTLWQDAQVAQKQAEQALADEQAKEAAEESAEASTPAPTDPHADAALQLVQSLKTLLAEL